MVITISTWALQLEPTKKFSLIVERDFRVTNAALGETLTDEKGRSVVKVSIDEESPDSDSDEETEPQTSETVNTVLCSLRAGLVEQTTLDITFLAGQQLEFQVTGKNTVHLLGNYIDQDPMDMPPFGDDDDDSDDEEEAAYRLQDVSSDVEMDPADLAGLEDGDSDEEARFEEIPADDAPKGKKRPRESDVSAGADAESGKLSKNQQKKLAKKLKGENGEAIPAGKDEKPKNEKPKSKTDEKPKSKADEKPKSKADKSKSKAEGDKPKSKAGEPKTLPGGLIIQDTTIGTGPAAKKGQKLSMRYIGKLTNGKVFDKNTGGPPFSFKLGKGEVIKGWDLGLVGMQPGGERLLTIPAPLAYGPRGAPPDIPPNATLKFEVKLVSAV